MKKRNTSFPLILCLSFISAIALLFVTCDNPKDGSSVFYTIIFDSNGGTHEAGEIFSSTSTSRRTVYQPADPTRTGWIFKGWFTDNDTFKNPYDFYTKVTSDLTLYAKWAPIPSGGGGGGSGGGGSGASGGTGTGTTGGGTTGGGSGSGGGSTGGGGTTGGDGGGSGGSGGTTGGDGGTGGGGGNTGGGGTTGGDGGTGGGGNTGGDNPVAVVSFDSNGGTDILPRTVHIGDALNLDPDEIPDKPKFVFDKWYTDDNTFSTPYDFSAPVTKDITLYANWVFTVSFEANGGNTVSSQNVEPGSTATQPSAPTRNGYDFCGWYIDNNTFNTRYDFSAPVTANTTLYAKWILTNMVGVPKGSFKMGIDAIVQEGEGPQHDVTITNDFYISSYEVTQALFESVMGYNPSVFKGSNLPVETVNWYEAVEFCNKLSEQGGLTPVYTLSNRTPATGYPITRMKVTVNWDNNGYRLPTEAEWEYASKGGNGSPGNYVYSGSDNLGSVAWYLGNSGNTTHAVGTKAPNGLGIYDMSGNVWEWCWDQYEKDYYAHSPLSDPRGSGNNTVDNDRTRVMRGGCFSSDDVRPRSVNRWRHIPSYNVDTNGISEYQGFRIVCNSP